MPLRTSCELNLCSQMFFLVLYISQMLVYVIVYAFEIFDTLICVIEDV